MGDIAKHLAESYPDQSDNWMHWAFALREMDQIEEAQEVAREAKRGLWAEGDGVAPWDWRQGVRKL
jgi:endonuclease YncB( thermonuclease family)